MYNMIDPKRLRRRMVQDQLIARGILAQPVINAMLEIPRHCFVPEALQSQAYADTPLPIGYGQTISQPYTVALMSQYLNVESGMRVLEVGTGSGYQAAILAKMGCTVFSIERIPELYAQTKELLHRLDLRSIHLLRRDGTLGLPEAAPFDRIIVTAGGPKIPAPLVEQLDEDGIMLVPVGERPRSQRLTRIMKQGNTIREEDLGHAVFVDLVGDHGWPTHKKI